MAVIVLLLMVKPMSSHSSKLIQTDLPMFSHCGSFSIGPCRLLPHAKLNGANLEISTCHVNFSV